MFKKITSNFIHHYRFLRFWRWFFYFLGKESRNTLIFALIIGLFIGFSDLIILWIFKSIFSEQVNSPNLIITIFLVITNTLIRIFGTRYTFKAAAKLTTKASQKIYNSTLDMNFEDFDKKNSSFYLTRISYVSVMGDNLILSLVSITSLLGGAFIVILGALYFTGIKGFTALLFTLIGYYLVNKITRLNTKSSKEIAKIKSKEIVLLTQESILSGKEIRIHEKGNKYKKKYQEIDSLLRDATAINFSANSITKYGVEGIGIIIISILIQLSRGEGIQAVVVMGLTFIRILPSFQGLFTLINNTLFYSYTFDGLKELNEIHNRVSSKNWIIKENHPDFILKFDNVRYKYHSNSDWKGLNINFQIKKSLTIVITGTSGAGKSTFLDLLCNLRKPNSGKIIINKNYIRNKNTKFEKIDFSYLGQNNKLYDCSILENIVEKEDTIDKKRLKTVLSVCALNELLEKRENGINTKVGEFGKEFSGGQIQRILLAKTLYDKSKIVILDEFTSALDSNNSQKIIFALIEFIKKENRVLIAASHDQNIINYFDEHWIINEGVLNKKS